MGSGLDNIVYLNLVTYPLGQRPEVGVSELDIFDTLDILDIVGLRHDVLQCLFFSDPPATTVPLRWSQFYGYREASYISP